MEDDAQSETLLASDVEGEQSAQKVASICTGLGVAEMVFDSINFLVNHCLFSGASHELKAKTAFMCEYDPSKAAWLADAFKPPYLFKDMRSLGSGVGLDLVSKEFCQVPKVSGLTMGFPCTGISSQNNYATSFRDTASPTGAGFKSLLDYAAYAGDILEWVITENVRTLCNKSKKYDEKPIEIQNEEMGNLGFLPIHCLVNTAQFGIPQSRTRCWGLYIKKSLCKQSMDPGHLVRSLERAPVDMAEIFVEMAECSQPAVRSTKGEKWKDVFEEQLKTHGKGKVMKNLKALKQMTLPITDRELSILSVAVTQLLQKGFDPYAEALVIQDQNFERATFVRSNPRLVPCLLPNGKYIVTKAWRLLNGKDRGCKKLNVV
ncbi:unnamed protein product [Effrenium voratum]|nr:unnamed protein product [Effrenium voratum]